MTIGLDKAESGGRYCPTCEKTWDSGDRCPDDGTRLVKLGKEVDTLLGRDLDGRYTIVERIGKGGMGTVYRATQHGLGREVAIKVVTPSLVAEPVIIKRFLRESKLASRLSHPNAVSVLDFGQTDDGLFYLVMELVKGRTLDKVIAEGALAPARVIKIGAQICDALECAHALHIIHRDLKPANVILMAASRDIVKVLDFGLAKSLSPDASMATMTNAGALVGTPAFMPPESVTGGVVDARSDLYSLGCILYTALTAKLPFQTASVPELIAMHASEPVPPLVGVPVGLANAVERLLAKDPSARYQDAATTREALEAALSMSNEVVEVAEPTLVAGSATILGWTSQHDSRQPAPSAQIPMPSPASLVPIHGKRVTPLPADDSELMSSSPTMLAPEGITPIVPSVARAATPTEAIRPVRKNRALPIVLALVLVVAAGAGAFMFLRTNDAPPPRTPTQTPPPVPAPTQPAPAPAPAPAPTPAPATTPSQSAPTEPAPSKTAPTEPTPTPTESPKPTRPNKPPRNKPNDTPAQAPIRLNPGIGGN